MKKLFLTTALVLSTIAPAAATEADERFRLTDVHLSSGSNWKASMMGAEVGEKIVCGLRLTADGFTDFYLASNSATGTAFVTQTTFNNVDPTFDYSSNSLTVDCARDEAAYAAACETEAVKATLFDDQGNLDEQAFRDGIFAARERRAELRALITEEAKQ